MYLNDLSARISRKLHFIAYDDYTEATTVFLQEEVRTRNRKQIFCYIFFAEIYLFNISGNEHF